MKKLIVASFIIIGFLGWGVKAQAPSSGTRNVGSIVITSTNSGTGGTSSTAASSETPKPVLTLPIDVPKTVTEKGCPKGYTLTYILDNVLNENWVDSTGGYPSYPRYEVCVDEKLLEKLRDINNPKKSAKVVKK
jgi:hypothetical protein